MDHTVYEIGKPDIPQSAPDKFDDNIALKMKDETLN
jgi:hypothetical protein